MKRLLTYFKGYTKEAVLGPLFKLLEACLELTVPLAVAQIIDVAIPNGDRGYALNMCFVLLGIGAVGLAFAVVAQYFAAKASVGVCTRLRESLFDKIQTLSKAQTDALGSSTLITRLTGDMNQLQTGINLALRLMLRSPFVVLGAAVMAFTVDVKSAVIFTVVIPLLAAVVFGIMLICLPLYKRVQSRLDGITSSARESLTGVRVIRAFRREQAEREEFAYRNGLHTEEQRRVGRISALLNPVTYVILNLAVIVLLYSGALRIDAGDLTPGQLVALYNYMSQILVELIKFADLIINVTKAVSCGSRISDVLSIVGEDGVEKADSHASRGGARVSFENVSFKYPASKEYSLKGITFTASPGERIGIIGSTGSGKSTLVNLIPCFYKPTEGEIKVDGKSTADYSLGELRSKIALVPQKISLFKGTLRENISVGKRNAADGEIFEALKAAQAEDFVLEKGGLDFAVEQKGRNLSGGQRQRIAIARALVRRPQILILDDSSSALDFLTDAALRSALKSFGESTTVFTVSQRTSSIEDCDKIIVLEEGEAVGIGSHAQLLASCTVYREIYDSQFKTEEASK